MSNIVFASNNGIHWPGILTGGTPNVHYRSDRVPYALSFSQNIERSSPVFTPVAGNDCWIHMTVYAADVAVANQKDVLKAWDVNNNRLFSLYKLNGSGSFYGSNDLRNGDTTTIGQTCTNGSLSYLNNIDLHYVNTGTSMSLFVYFNQLLESSVTIGTNPNSYGQVARISINPGWTDGNNEIMHVSEIIVSDTDTRLARMDLLRPNLPGYLDEWIGNQSLLEDDNSLTGLTTIAAEKTHMMTLDPYAGPANISNVVQITTTTRGINSPPRLMHRTRMSAVNYDSPIYDVDFSAESQVTDHNENPATSLPWVATDLPNIENGFISKAAAI